MVHETPLVKCSEPACEATYKDHRWGKIKAADWFHEKSGKSWCPEHHPKWVAAWQRSRDGS